MRADTPPHLIFATWRRWAAICCSRLQCWYFRSADFQCLRKGKDFCFAFTGLNQYHAIMDYGTALRWRRPRLLLRSWR